MGIKRNFDASISTPTPVKTNDSNQAKINRWIENRDSKVSVSRKDWAKKPRLALGALGPRKGNTAGQELQDRVNEINDGLDTTKALKRWSDAKPNLEKQIKMLETCNTQVQIALKEVLDGLLGRLHRSDAESATSDIFV